jgi:hypothetical protein
MWIWQEKFAASGTPVAMQYLIDGFHLISHKTTYDNHEEYGWPYSP